MLYFNPRPPRGGRRAVPADAGRWAEISIHAPREGGDAAPLPAQVSFHISIHAPREGGDVAGVLICQWHNSISIHAPREGGDTILTTKCQQKFKFQSTPPARGATLYPGLFRLPL